MCPSFSVPINVSGSSAIPFLLFDWLVDVEEEAEEEEEEEVVELEEEEEV